MFFQRASSDSLERSLDKKFQKNDRRRLRNFRHVVLWPSADAEALVVRGMSRTKLTCRMVGCVMWCPLTKVRPSACNGVTVHTPSCSDMRQWRGWIDGPNSCSALVFAEPTSTGSLVSFNLRPPSPECVISISIGPSRSVVMFPPPLLMPSGFFFRRRGCESTGGRRRTWNMIDPELNRKRKRDYCPGNSIKLIWFTASISYGISDSLQSIMRLYWIHNGNLDIQDNNIDRLIDCFYQKVQSQRLKDDSKRISMERRHASSLKRKCDSRWGFESRWDFPRNSKSFARGWLSLSDVITPCIPTANDDIVISSEAFCFVFITRVIDSVFDDVTEPLRHCMKKLLTFQFND